MIASVLLAAALSSNCGEIVPLPSGGDYLNPDDRNKLLTVESFHFTKEVETLKGGASGTVGGDLDYTLERFPNHHRALAAMARYGLRHKGGRAPNTRYPVECYFERALRFNPRDVQVHNLYAGYLLALKLDDAALAQLEQVVEIDPENATAHYNLGLLHARRKAYQKAREHAAKAYARGFPLQGLKNKLVAAGQWEAGPQD